MICKTIKVPIFQTQYLRADGTGLVHIVRECPRNYHLAYIVRKGSPYQPIFNRMLLKFFESGNCTQFFFVDVYFVEEKKIFSI